MNRRVFLRSCTILSVALALQGQAAYAMSWPEAMSAAYMNNPRIQQERSRQVATDELVSQASAGFKPTVGATYVRGKQQTSVNGGTEVRGTSEQKGVRLEQPLYRGGAFDALNSARQQVKAGEYTLIATEQQVMLEAVTAYMDVSTSQAMLELARNNAKLMGKEQDAARGRFKIGTVTKTDVAQAESRAADAVAAVAQAESQLNTASATFERVLGMKPEGNLQSPDPLPAIPASLNEALEVGRSASPSLLAAIHAAKSSQYDVGVNEGALLPRVSLVGEMNRNQGVGAQGSSQFDQDRVSVQLSIPLYQAGAEYSRIREAKAIARQRDHATIDARQAAQEAITTAWGQLKALNATITARQTQVKAVELAVEGMKKEYQFGTRMLLDVLNTEQELFTAQTNLVQAQRDKIVAVYTLLLQLGALTPEAFGIDTAVGGTPEKVPVSG